MRSTISLGAIAGIRVGVHYSWFLVLGLFSWYLSQRLLPMGYLLPGADPGWPTATYWATGTVVALLLFASVLVHELAHSVVARARGFPVEGITLFMLGGVSNLGREPSNPRDEFVISAVGPATSLLLSGLLVIVDLVSPGDATPLTAIIRSVWVTNLVMAVFNLLPAFPMDGGRLLHSIVWAITNNMDIATRFASRGGQVIGILLIALGVFEVLGGNVPAGIWSGFIGWFIFSAATRTRRESGPQPAIDAALVRDVMGTDPTAIGPDISLAEAVNIYLLRQDRVSLPVCDEGRLIGMLALTDVSTIPRDEWKTLTVRQSMSPTPLWVLHPGDDLSKALALLAEHSINQAPVVIGERLVGLVSRADIIDYLHAQGIVVGGSRSSVDRQTGD